MEPVDVADGVCTVYCDSDIPCGVMEWHGYATVDIFKEASERLAEVMQLHRLDRLLVDTTDLPILGGKERDYLVGQWLPNAISNGLKAAALVTSRHYFARVGVETVNQNLTPEDLILEYFTHPSTAREWLRDLTLPKSS